MPVILFLTEVLVARAAQPEHAETQLEIGDPGIQQLRCDRVAVAVEADDHRERGSVVEDAEGFVQAQAVEKTDDAVTIRLQSIHCAPNAETTHIPLPRLA